MAIRPQSKPRAVVASRRPGKSPAAKPGAEGQATEERKPRKEKKDRESLPDEASSSRSRTQKAVHLILEEKSEEDVAEVSLRLNKFERVRLLGERACELAAGKEPKVPCAGVLDPLVVATQEFEAGLLELRLVRCFPNGGTSVHSLLSER